MGNTLYRAGDALPMFRTERVTGENKEMVYDASGRAHFTIIGNDVVYNLDGTPAYWVAGNYLIAPGGRPAFYFDLTREDELVVFIRSRSHNEELIRRFKSAFAGCEAEAQSIVAALGD
jgi:hypothetical protein